MTSILKADTIQDTDGNNIINENSNAVTIGKAADTVSIPGSATLGASGKTITIPSGCTIANSGTATGFGETNSPNFHAFDASQTLNNTTWTKLDVATERFDNGSAYDTSTSKFTVPSGEGGVYLFNGMYRMENDSGSSFLKFYKNGSALNDFVSEFHGSSYFAVNCTIMVNLSASDYIEMYGYINVGNTNGIADINFQGFKVSS